MLVVGDAALIPLPDESIHCIITSPPYWGLRKYTGVKELGRFPRLGLEETMDEHIKNIVEIFDEFRRVLRPDGVVWLNYGDCYAGGGRGGHQEIKLSRNWQPEYQKINASLLDGNLLLLPHRIAIALQSRGWMVREDSPWWKRNPMPESLGGWRWERHKVQTKDGNWVECEGCQKCLHDNPDFPDLHVMRLGSWRHTRAHEYVFMLTKQMNYFCDQEEMREPVSGNAHAHGKGIGRKLIKFGEGVRANKDFGEATRNETAADLPKTRNPRTGIEVDDLFGEWSHFFYYVMEYAPWLVERFLKDMTNPDDVFDVPAGSYSGKHFATFPPDLIAPLMRASCPKHCCPECGNAWAPIVDPSYFNDTTTDGRPAKGNHKKLADQKIMASGERTRLIVRTSGYAPTCDCGCETPIPGIVLDPFAGSGTTGMVAKELGRRWIAMDISEPYLDLQARLRTKWGKQKTKIDDLPLFSDLEGA